MSFFTHIINAFGCLGLKLTLSSFSEFSLDDSPVGSFSLYNPVDVALWSQSVSGVPFSEADLFPVCQQDLPDMAGHFLDQPLAKDDEVSISSSLDDSTYMSMPDSGRRAVGSADITFNHGSRDPRSQMMDPFLGHNLYSPTLSSDSQSVFPGSQADMSQMFLPPAVGDAENAISDFTNYHGQMYGRPASFDFQGNVMPRFISAGDVDAGQDQWSNTEVQMYSRPFAVGPVEGTTYFPPRHQTHGQHNAMAHRFVVPSSYGSQVTSPNTFTARSTSMHRRPRLSRLPRSMTSVSDMSGQATVSSKQGADAATMMSPTASLLSNVVQKDEPEGGLSEEPQSFLDMSSADLEMEKSASESMIFSALKEDEFDDDEYAVTRSGSGQTSLEEAESKLARTHPLYQATPSEDDLYHCPNEGQPGCAHKPTKLKCNYDKYVDSHLRPFRCKVTACVGVQFSSTACLLRHEREAHGMHGHGSKPHLCTYPDCERSIPGNGFPRRYNLFDHMKRVHDYTGSTSPTEGASPRGQPTLKRQNSRKRKSAPAEESNEKRPRMASKSSSASTATMMRNARLQEKRKLEHEWEQRKALLQQRVNNLQNPHDLNSHLEANEDLAVLQKIAQRINELG